MNNENIIDFMNNNSTFNNTFDFGKNWEDKFEDNEDEDIIIGKNEQSDSEDDLEFDASFEDEDKILNILRDEKEEKEISFDKALTSESTELDKFFDSIYNGVEDANELL